MALIHHGRARSETTRHIDIKHFYVKNYVDRGQITVQYKCTEEMLADFFTKPLASERFIWLRNKIMGQQPEEWILEQAEEATQERTADDYVWDEEPRGAMEYKE